MIADKIKELLTVKNILSIFLTYIRKRNIIGIDNIDNKFFQKNIVNYANHIENTVENYKYSPYLEKLISKGRMKQPRIVSIPTIKDRIVLYVLKNLLHELFPESVNTELVNKKIIDIYNFFASKSKYSVIRLDIKGFYDSINQKILLDQIQTRSNSGLFLALIEKAISNPTVPKKYHKFDREKYSQDCGIPQGLAISNILANIYLYSIDQLFENDIQNYYYRYVDDILILCNQGESQQIYNKIRKSIKRIGLELNLDKSIIHFSPDSFTFLGYVISKNKISIKDESIQNHINAIFALLCNYNRMYNHKELRDKWLTDELLINRIESDINEKITGALSENKKYGWLFYFGSINDTTILKKLNKIVVNAINRILPNTIIKKINLKSYVRSFYEMKNKPKSGYIKNYDIYDTLLKKIDYLIKRGYIDSTKKYSEDEINYIFISVREKNLSRMQKDIGNLS